MKLNEFEIETDARLIVLEAITAAILDQLIDQGFCAASVGDSLRSALPSIGLTHWKGLDPVTSDAMAAARQDALERFLGFLAKR